VLWFNSLEAEDTKRMSDEIAAWYQK